MFRLSCLLGVSILAATAWPGRQQRREPRPGVIFSSNVYQNAPAELRGRAKYLRVMTIDPKTCTYWSQRPYISTGPVVSIVQSEGVKRVLGTVPIEADGSRYHNLRYGNDFRSIGDCDPTPSSRPAASRRADLPWDLAG
jgi:hypothetical protein